MLAPRNAATDEEDSDVDSHSEAGSSGSETSEKKQVTKDAALEGHAVDIGDSPLVSEDDSLSVEPVAQPTEEIVPEENPQEPPEQAPDAEAEVENEAEPGVKEKGPQPYDVPVVGDFYMHDDRCTAAQAKAQPASQHRTSKWSEGINASRWKHDKFEQLEREFERRATRGRGRRGREIPSHRGRWMKNKDFPSPRAQQTFDLQYEDAYGGPSRGRGRSGSRGYRARGRGYSGRFNMGHPHQPYEHYQQHI